MPFYTSERSILFRLKKWLSFPGIFFGSFCDGIDEDILKIAIISNRVLYIANYSIFEA
jgi:hypothetical protein